MPYFAGRQPHDGGGRTGSHGEGRYNQADQFRENVKVSEGVKNYKTGVDLRFPVWIVCGQEEI